MTINRYNCNGRFYEAISYGDILYLSGQVANGANISEQSRKCLENLETTLKKYNSDKQHILSATVYLADIKYLSEFNLVWDSWFAPEEFPVRTCIGAQLASPEYLVEITLIATVNDSSAV